MYVTAVSKYHWSIKLLYFPTNLKGKEASSPAMGSCGRCWCERENRRGKEKGRRGKVRSKELEERRSRQNREQKTIADEGKRNSSKALDLGWNSLRKSEALEDQECVLLAHLVSKWPFWGLYTKLEWKSWSNYPAPMITKLGPSLCSSLQSPPLPPALFPPKF